MKTDPFPHQEKEFVETKDSTAFGHFWEQGTAKSKVVIDTTGYNFEETGKVNGLIVLAPPGVERNWITDELPKHLPDRIMKQTMMKFYQSKRSTTKWHQKEMKELTEHRGLSILTMTYDAFVTNQGKLTHWNFIRNRDCLYNLDEGQKIKAEQKIKRGNKRNRSASVVPSGCYGVMRRITSGTLGVEGPMDCYEPVNFLDPKFWHDHQLASYSTYKNFFGRWKTYETPIPGRYYKSGPRKGQQKMGKFEKCVEYKNLEKLRLMLREISSRVDKSVLGLPPKLYSNLYFEMSVEQKKVYEQLKTEYYVEIDGQFIDAEMSVTRLIRLQQVACGYLHSKSDEPKIMIGKTNPRLEAVVEYCSTLTHQTIIWARFKSDIDQIMEALGDEAVRYDGQVSPDQCQWAKEQFQQGKFKYFVATPDKGATGLTLHMAKTVIYYSNSFKLEDRLQSEDRAHRAGMDDSPVNYIDVIAPETVDGHIVESLKGKYDVFHQITGDELKDWIQ
jgi:hypothetical protein